MLIDTHCHLTHSPLFESLPTVLAEAAAQDVQRFLVPGTCPDDWADITALAQSDNRIHMALGLHPWFVPENNVADSCSVLTALLRRFPNALVGEIGLDFLRAADAVTQTQQIAAFEMQLDLAQSLGRAVVVHNVKASQACLDSIRRCGFTQGGFAHGFSGSLEEAREWVKCGFKIGMGALLLRPNTRKIRRIAAELPLADMVLETDAPYMSPVRDVPNAPKNSRLVAEKIAEIKQIGLAEVARQTTQNVGGTIKKLVIDNFV